MKRVIIEETFSKMFSNKKIIDGYFKAFDKSYIKKVSFFFNEIILVILSLVVPTILQYYPFKDIPLIYAIMVSFGLVVISIIRESNILEFLALNKRIYPVYGIALLEKIYFDDAKPFHVFSLREEETNEELTVKPRTNSKQHSLLKIAFLELEKYQPEIISDFDVKKWFEFFGNRNFTIQPDQIISQAEHALDFTTWIKEEQDMWDKQLDRYLVIGQLQDTNILK
ncbi:TPA: hypothetical protein U1334_002262 [Streptococcus suis]|nr:hypothetical protein [Streptococcus suis]